MTRLTTRFGVAALLLTLVGCGQSTSTDGSTGKVQQALSTGLVISQVYGGGGGSTGTYKQDYIEIFNRGSTSVAVAGKSVQYASTTGPSTGMWAVFAIPAATPDLEPGQYLLIETGTAGSMGAAAPVTPDVTGGSLNLSGTGGKVALVSGTTPLTCGATTRCADATIIDLVGYGTASDYEGTAPAPATTSASSVVRKTGGCTETDDNLADFELSTTVTFRNRASTRNVCSGATDAGLDALLDVAIDVELDAAVDTATLDVAADTPVDASIADAPADTVIAVDAPVDTKVDAPIDTGTMVTDTGTAPTDTGTAPTDTGSEPEDTGNEPADTGFVVRDTGTADTGVDIAPVEAADEGCSCTTPKSSSNDGAALAALAVGVIIAARRRRR
jgi:MYXO-CTERM domain-containing protein